LHPLLPFAGSYVRECDPSSVPTCFICPPPLGISPASFGDSAWPSLSPNGNLFSHPPSLGRKHQAVPFHGPVPPFPALPLDGGRRPQFSDMPLLNLLIVNFSAPVGPFLSIPLYGQSLTVVGIFPLVIPSPDCCLIPNPLSRPLLFPFTESVYLLLFRRLRVAPRRRCPFSPFPSWHRSLVSSSDIESNLLSTCVFV